MARENSIRKLSKSSNLLILGTTTLLYVIIGFLQIRALGTKSFILTKSDLFTIDSVKMLSRAYIIGGGKSSSKSIEFEDEAYKTFWLEGSRYLAVKNLSELYDTLQYSDLLMKIYTDKKGYDKYHDKKSKGKIEVMGIQIGNKSYIALDEINREERKGRISIIVFSSIAYLIFLLIHLMRVLKNKSIHETVLRNGV